MRVALGWAVVARLRTGAESFHGEVADGYDPGCTGVRLSVMALRSSWAPLHLERRAGAYGCPCLLHAQGEGGMDIFPYSKGSDSPSSRACALIWLATSGGRSISFTGPLPLTSCHT